jgi:hypothetical protein
MRDDARGMSRRALLRGSLGAATGMGMVSAVPTSVVATPPAKQAETPQKNDMPCGTIGERKISRLILGSNAPGAHSRDLIYVSQLGRAYCTKERMLDMYELAESQGINTVLQGNTGLIKEYNRTRGGNLRQIVPVTVREDYDRDSIKKTLTAATKNPVAAMWYIWGDCGDYLARAKRMDLVGVAMEVSRELGITLGLAGHSLQVPIQCEELGIKPDFYVKTFHHDKYWSATPKENRKDFCWYANGGNSYSGKTGRHDQFHDNIWCLDAEKTVEVMNKVNVPWIAFKVLAAGAISPTSGFKFAFQGGADFVAVGMCDFHVKDNVQVLRGLFARGIKRERPWIA